jgi:hypothetical protein
MSRNRNVVPMLALLVFALAGQAAWAAQPSHAAPRILNVDYVTLRTIKMTTGGSIYLIYVNLDVSLHAVQGCPEIGRRPHLNILTYKNGKYISNMHVLVKYCKVVAYDSVTNKKYVYDMCTNCNQVCRAVKQIAPAVVAGAAVAAITQAINDSWPLIERLVAILAL